MEEKIYTVDKICIALNYYKRDADEVVIIAPGWCMTKDSKSFRKIAGIFRKHYDVIAFDFRGHGKSEGFYTFSSQETKDLDAVVNFARNKNYKKIHLVGFSLGAAVVLINSAKYNNIAGNIIVVSPPSDFGKIENHMWKKAAWKETFKKFELKRFMSLRFCLVPKKKIKPIDIVKNINKPILFIAGEKDPTVYYWHTKLLYDNATTKKEYKLFKGGYHAEDLYLHFRNEFSTLCLNWLKDV